ncbi:MAG: DUF3109 family protein [Bacteroidota bacterium]
MIAIEDTLVSEDLLERKFVCDLNKCKGECCIAGDVGAPLDADELPVLTKIYNKVKPYMSSRGIKEVEKHGLYILDGGDEYSTPLVQGKECAYVYFENEIAFCAIEKAYKEGKIDFKKPISCHLYPVRITKHKGYEAVNYDKWDICNPACKNGKKLGVPVYVFLQESLTRKYGEGWYKQLTLVAAELEGLED